jgi:hypothetical protein
LPDGRVGEIFLDGGKVDAVPEMARESAIVVSLALHCGCSIETLRHALSGRGEGPLSPEELAQILAKLAEERAAMADPEARKERRRALSRERSKKWWRAGGKEKWKAHHLTRLPAPLDATPST